MVTKIALVGEAWGAEEEAAFRATGIPTPFIGPAGQELDRMLAEVGINRSECYVTNVFNLRPPSNDIATLCCRAKDPGRAPDLPALSTGNYLRSEHSAHLNRLAGELGREKPNLAVALGNTACWALLGSNGISKLRGATALSSLVPGLKVLPTYHPSAVLRQWSLRPVTIVDLEKAKCEAEYSEIRRQRRVLWLDPTLLDLANFWSAHISHADEIVYDIETKIIDGARQMTNMGFAPSRSVAINIPFFDPRKPGNSYWPTQEQELWALAWIRRVFTLATSGVQFCAQNGLYDMSWLWGRYGIPCPTAHDTMLLHHAIQPESPKALDFLGSVYADEMTWKLLNRRKEAKRDS